jgi:hypothetical protein
MVRDDETIHEVVWPTLSERLAAHRLLVEICGIKAPVPSEVEMTVTRNEDGGGAPDVDFSKLSAAELESYLKLVEKASSSSSKQLVSPPDANGVIDVE